MHIITSIFDIKENRKGDATMLFKDGTCAAHKMQKYVSFSMEALGQNMANFWCEQLVQGNQSTNLLNFIAPLVRCSIEPSQHVSGTFPQAVKRIA